MRYLAVLGRQPKISIAELESLYARVSPVDPEWRLAEFEIKTAAAPTLRRLGGSLKLAEELTEPIYEFLKSLPSDRKITLGVSDYSKGATAFKAQGEALKLKRFLAKSERSVRVVPNKEAVISTATSYHNHLFTSTKIELIKYEKRFYRVIAVQDIDSYTKRDQARPARDAKVGMLPPKLAQILINLCGDLPQGARVLDPFCGTGVVLQEAALMGYTPYGTDINERMVEYSRKNLDWLRSAVCEGHHSRESVSSSTRQQTIITQGDATKFRWQPPIDAVACETYLGQPMSLPPAEIKLKQEKQVCKQIVLGFLKNLLEQIQPETPVTIAVPAWLRPDGHYERLNILDEIQNLGYNVKSFRNLGQEDLLYHRDGQVVAREIIALRKK